MLREDDLRRRNVPAGTGTAATAETQTSASAANAEKNFMIDILKESGQVLQQRREDKRCRSAKRWGEGGSTEKGTTTAALLVYLYADDEHTVIKA